MVNCSQINSQSFSIKPLIIKGGTMGKYEIQPLSASRKADIVRTVLAEPANLSNQLQRKAPTKTPSRETANGILNQAFRAAINR